MGLLGFEPRSKAYFRESIIIAYAQLSITGGPHSSQAVPISVVYTTAPHESN